MTTDRERTALMANINCEFVDLIDYLCMPDYIALVIKWLKKYQF
jgi:hypothetical protein